MRSILPSWLASVADHPASTNSPAITEARGAKIKGTRLLRRSESAHYVTDTWGIPLSKQTLAKLAVVGGGPEYRKAGRFPLYDPSDLDAWAKSKLGPKLRSTSDGLKARGQAIRN